MFTLWLPLTYLIDKSLEIRYKMKTKPLFKFPPFQNSKMSQMNLKRSSYDHWFSLFSPLPRNGDLYPEHQSVSYLSKILAKGKY